MKPLETPKKREAPDQTSVPSLDVTQQLRGTRISSHTQEVKKRKTGGNEGEPLLDDVLKHQAKEALERRRDTPKDTSENLLIARELRRERAEGFTIAIERADKPGEMIEIHYIQPESRLFFRDFSIASILDFDKQARDLHTHLTNGQTNEALVSLYQLQHEQGAVDALNHALKRTYKIDLNTTLAEHWSGPTLEYGRQLIGAGEKTSEFAITHAPATSQDITHLAKRLNHILNKTEQFIPEKLFAALTPLRRNADLINRIKTHYETEKFGSKNLLADIREKLGTGEAADFVEFLWGEPKLAKHTFTPQEAENLSAAFSHQSFEWGQAYKSPEPQYSRVPYSNPLTGCNDQALIMRQSTKEMGCALEQIIVAGYDSNGQSALKRSTDYAPDTAINVKPSFSYILHTAPEVQVQTDTEPRKYIIDPSMNQDKAKLWPVDDWQQQLYRGPIEHKLLAEMKEIFEEQERKDPSNKHSYPNGRVFSFMADRNYVTCPKISSAIPGPESDIPDLVATTYYRQKRVQALANLVSDSRYYTLAAAIRQEHASNFNAERFARTVRAIDSRDNNVRKQFSRNFPKLHTSFAATLTEAQRKAFYNLIPAS